jgi:hypothetical protein
MAQCSTICRNVLSKFNQRVSSSRRQEFANCTLQDVQTAIADVQLRLGAERKLRNMNKIAAFLEAISQLGTVVEVFLNVSEFVAFIWVSRG